MFKKFSRILIAKIIYRVVEYNKPDLSQASYILCPNHVSDADGPVMWVNNENIRILAKKECFKNKLFAWFLEKLDIVKIDRDRHTGAELLSAIHYFADGKNKIFMLFPQGTISDIHKNKLSRIKPGAFYISVKAGVPIIPVFIEQPRAFRKTRVVYGKPMDLKDVISSNGKIDRKKVEEYRLKWQQEIFALEEKAVKYGKKPVRALKLSPKHQNNNE